MATPDDIPADWRGQLDLRAEIARIDRERAETRKLIVERTKLDAETKKFNRDPWLYIAAALLAFLAAVVARLPEIIQALR